MKERRTHIPSFGFKMKENDKNLIKNEKKNENINENIIVKSNKPEGRLTAVNKERKFFGNILYHIFGFESKEEEEKLIERTSNKSKKNNKGNENEKQNLNNKNQIFFIPCTNCGDLIYIEEIEKHSEKCINLSARIKEESIDSINDIDHKLKKLYEHIECIKKNSEVNKDTHFLIALSQYINNSLSLNVIENNTILALKKLCTNLDILLVNFKGSCSVLVLIERTKALFTDKINIIKKDLKEIIITEKTRNSNMGSRKSALVLNKDLKDLLEVNKKVKEKIEKEKELIKNKVNNLQQTVDSDLEKKSRK